MNSSDHKTATYCEIMQQPDVWLKAYDLVCRNEAAIQTFISNNHIGRIPKLSWRVLERRPLLEMHWPGFLWKKAILNVEP